MQSRRQCNSIFSNSYKTMDQGFEALCIVLSQPTLTASLSCFLHVILKDFDQDLCSCSFCSACPPSLSSSSPTHLFLSCSFFACQRKHPLHMDIFTDIPPRSSFSSYNSYKIHVFFRALNSFYYYLFL